MAASSSSVSRPHVMVPSASRDTTRPLRPSARCSTRGQLTGAPRPGSARDTGLGTPALAARETDHQGGPMSAAEERLHRLLHAGDQAAWTTAALVIALRDAGPEAHRAAAEEVLRALDVDVDEGTRD